ncbi:FprA family A-type flavoprotein [Ruminococcaceae bacterium OttesenSCG-928-D13]|nr:FprA family A-type flavoprotein [Ruminococcaceae bacterium OttesenSCG-928-D13]
MENVQNITPQIAWVGGSDRRLALFENLFPLENGVTYNAWLIKDEKTALIDTVDASVTHQFFASLETALDGRGLDYLVVSHMEPDHCANIGELCRRWPQVQLVGNKMTFQLIRQFHDVDIEGRCIEVQEGQELSLGRHNLRFVMAPMVHWPEVMFTYETTENILFAADAFGTFGGASGNLFSDEVDYAGLYLDEARRYYTNIVGKFGPQVLAAMKKLDGLSPAMICSLHGPVLRGEAIPLLLDKYAHWAAYKPEKQGVVLAYASMYGNTEAVAHKLAALLAEKGVEDLRMYDVSKTHYSEIIAQVFKYSHLVLASPTYNLHLYCPMDTLVRDLAALNVQNRDVAIIGNGSWAPSAHTTLQKMVEEDMKDMRLLAPPMLVRSTLKPEQLPELEALAEKLAASVKEKQ